MLTRGVLIVRLPCPFQLAQSTFNIEFLNALILYSEKKSYHCGTTDIWFADLISSVSRDAATGEAETAVLSGRCRRRRRGSRTGRSSPVRQLWPSTGQHASYAEKKRAKKAPAFNGWGFGLTCPYKQIRGGSNFLRLRKTPRKIYRRRLVPAKADRATK